MEVGSAETTLNGGSADPMPVCIGDAQINYFFFKFGGSTGSVVSSGNSLIRCPSAINIESLNV